MKTTKLSEDSIKKIGDIVNEISFHIANLINEKIAGFLDTTKIKEIDNQLTLGMSIATAVTEYLTVRMIVNQSDIFKIDKNTLVLKHCEMIQKLVSETEFDKGELH